MINLFLNLYLTLNHLTKINLLIWHKLAHEHAMGNHYKLLIVSVLGQTFNKASSHILSSFILNWAIRKELSIIF